MISSTNKMILREWRPSDAQFLFNLNSDSEVIKYTGDSAFGSVNEAEIFIKNYSHFDLHGYGRWICELKSNGTPVGWAGLKNQLSTEGIIDIGFRFMRKYWNQGLATEAARECVKLGFESFDMDELTGRAAIENVYSGRVLERIGMKKMGGIKIHHGLKTSYYKITSEDYFILKK